MQKSEMLPSRLAKISEYFDVSLDYLITGKEHRSVTPIHLISDFEYEIILAFRAADSVDHATVIRALGLEEKEKEYTISA